MTNRNKLLRRLDAIDEKVRSAKCWGAMLTALEEERQAIARQLLNDGETEKTK